MSTKKVKSLEAKLIEAATHIIEMEGLENLSVRNVSAKANCSIGTLYNYFCDMNELILKINAKTLLKLQDVIGKSISPRQSKKILGKTLAKEYLGFALENLPFWNLLFKYKLPKGQTMPQWYLDIIDENFRLLESALKPHLDAKHVHKASRILWGACHGIILLSIEGKLDIASPESAETLCESLFENYLRGCK
jgi:AcrR family transcriptional regulator